MHRSDNDVSLMQTLAPMLLQQALNRVHSIRL